MRVHCAVVVIVIALATTVVGGRAAFGQTFTDDPVTAGTTTIKAVHVTELRTAIANLRGLLGLGVFTWTDDPLTGGTIVKASHIAEMRTALDQVYDAFPKLRPAYTDPTLTGLPIKAVHIEQLRSAVLNVVNTAPSFTKGANQTVSEDAGAQTVVGWATAISAGPGESTQVVNFVIDSNDNAGLFSTGPIVAANGTLTYTPAANQNGVANITLHIHDDGGTGHGGVDNSPTQAFTITINATNDAPVVTNKTYGPNGAQANMKIIGLTGLLTGVTDADSGVSGCSPTFTVTGVSGATSPAGGTVSLTNASTGTFDFDPPPGVTGNVTFTYTVQDTGCPGTATSAPATVTVNVAGPVIWFVDSTAPGGGNGTWVGTNAKAFQTVAQAAAVDANDHRIFVLNNNASSVTYTSAITLTTNEWLVGQGATNAPSTFDALFGIAPPAGTVARPAVGGVRPTLAQSAGTVVTLGAGNVVRGLNVTNSAGSGIVGSAVGTLVLADFDVTVTGGSAVSVTVSGTVTATGADNDLSATNGTALNVNAVTITAAGMTFKSIASSAVANGLVLNGTGSTGFLLVTGDGSQTGGFYDRDGTGGTIQNTTGDAVLLTNASNVTLRKMNLTNAGWDGVQSFGGGGIVLSAVDINTPGQDNPNSDGSTGNPSGFGGGNGWFARNITGANAFDHNSRVFNWQASQSNAVLLYNTDTNFTSFTFDKSLLTTSATGAAGFHANLNGATSGQVSLTNSEFTLIDQNAAQILSNGSGAVRAIVQGNNFHDSDATGGDGNNTLFLALAGSGDLNFTIGGATAALGNTFTNTARLSALAGIVQVNVAGGLPPSGAAGAQINGTIQNNTITNPGFVSGRRGIMVAGEASAGSHGGHTVAILNNSVQDLTGIGIYGSLTSVGGAYDLLNNSFTISNNQVGTIGAVGQGGGDSGSAIEFETNIATDGSGANISANILIQGNTAVSNNNSGIGDTLEIANRSGNGTGAGNTSVLNITVLGNNLTQLNAGGDVFQISNSVMTTTTVNVDLNSDNVSANRNTFTGGDADGVLLRNDAGTFRIENLTGGAEAFVEARNNGNFTTSGVAIVTTGAVPMPTNPSFLILAPGGVDANSSSQPVIVRALNQSELDVLVGAALARWTATGLTVEQLAALRRLTFEAADLPGWSLGDATGDRIRVDNDAGGNGWFISISALAQDDVQFAKKVSDTRRYADPASAPAGRIDLLTAVMHEMGHALGLPDSYAEDDRDSLMYGYLTKGERRMPHRSVTSRRSR